MKTRIAAVAVMASALSLASLAGRATPSLAGSDQAVAYQETITHTGALSGDALTPPLAKVWAKNLGGPISYPLIANGMIYVTVGNVANASTPNYGSTLYALDETTGNAVWSTALGGTYYWSAAAYDSGDVFAVNEDGLLRAFNAGSGALLWSAQMPGQYAFSSPPVAANGTVYLGGAGSGGTVYAVSESSGAVLWTSSVMNGDDSSPAVSGNSVYVSYACPQTYDLVGTSGAQIWHDSGACEGGGGSTPVLNAGTLYVRDVYLPTGGNMAASGAAFDAATGNELNSFTSSVPPAFAGNVGFFLMGGTLQAQDWTTPGAPATRWSFAGDGGLDSAPLIVNNDVYVGSSSGNLYALDVSSGQQVWNSNVGAAIPAANDEGSSAPTTGLGAGEGYLVVPAGNLLVAYRTAGAPSVTAVALSGTEGAAVSGTVATFTDPNPNPVGDTATITWGDGSTSTGSIVANGNLFTVTGSHTYAEEGSFTPSVTVSNGYASATADGTASIADAALQSSGSALPDAVVRMSFTAPVLSFSDGDPGCAASDDTATIAWGDGSSSTGTITAGSGTCSFTVTGTHTYASTGSHTIVTTVRDAGGSTTSNSSTITVKRHK